MSVWPRRRHQLRRTAGRSVLARVPAALWLRAVGAGARPHAHHADAVFKGKCVRECACVRACVRVALGVSMGGRDG